MSTGWEDRALFQPITADHPCGESLEDTPLLTSFDALRVFGQSRSLEAPPDPADNRKPLEWSEIRDRALEGLGKSKDLRLLAHLGAALLRTDGLPAFFGTLKVASSWLESYWPGVYPLVDEDAIARRNALNCFADPMAIVERLRRVPLVDSRQHGRFGLRDVDLATGQVPVGAADVRPDEAAIHAAFAETPVDHLTTLQKSVTDAAAALNGIDAKMRSEGGPEIAPVFDPLSGQLDKMSRLLRTELAARPGGNGIGTAENGEPGGASGAIGIIKSHQDAIRALDAVSDFFRRNEPSSPIPMLLDRAKRLVSKDFLEVLKEIAPEALAVARAAGGLRDGD
jgi:type VI secretion system protein ImpA